MEAEKGQKQKPVQPKEFVYCLVLLSFILVKLSTSLRVFLPTCLRFFPGNSPVSSVVFIYIYIYGYIFFYGSLLDSGWVGVCGDCWVLTLALLGSEKID